MVVRTLVVFILVVLMAAFAMAISINSQLEGPYSYVAVARTPIALEPSVSIVETTVIIAPGSSETNSVLDRIVVQSTPAVNGTCVSFNVQLGPQGGELEDWFVVSGNTNVATNANQYNLVYRTNGVIDATLTIWNTSGLTNNHVVNGLAFTKQTNTVVTSVLGGVAGSARKYYTDAVDNRINASVTNTMTPHGSIFTTQNHAATNYVRNTNSWVRRETPTDLTGISPYNWYANNTRAGTLITPQHVVCAAHYPIPAGTNSTIRFVDQTNGVVSKTVTHQMFHAGYVPYYPDLQILRLDSPVDTNRIKVAKVLPANWRTYFPTDIADIPAVGLDQWERATVTDGSRINDTNNASKFTGFKTPATNSIRYPYFANKIGGDSGNPAVFIPQDGSAPVLLTVWTFGGAGSGTSITDHVNGLNAAIQQLDTAAGVTNTYQVQTVDLSSFNEY